MSVVYVNNNKFLVKNGDKIIQKEIFSFSKNDIITSSIDIKDVITYTFKLPKTTPSEQLKIEAELHFYESAGLDMNQKFITSYIFKELQKEDSYLVEAIAVNESQLISDFSSLLEKSKWIDFISLPTFAFSEFYNLYKKEPQKDAFVYLDNNQSFITVYEKDEFLCQR